jgi:hypothetical protein
VRIRMWINLYLSIFEDRRKELSRRTTFLTKRIKMSENDDRILTFYGKI